MILEFLCLLGFGLCTDISAAGQGTVPEAPAGSSQPPVSIHVDLAKSIAPYKPIYSWFGYDEANYTTMRHGGIPPGVRRVLLEHFRLDETHSNAYTVWKSMGSPQNPTTEQYATLRAAGQLQTLTSPEWLDVINGQVVVSTQMPVRARLCCTCGGKEQA